MLKKHEHDFLAAQLAALDGLLASRSEADDPIGYLQYAARKIEIEEQLRGLTSRPEQDLEFVIAFGGEPLTSACGIDAAFAGDALVKLQRLITSQCLALQAASEASPYALAAPLHRSSMLLTEVARGSLAFVFEMSDDGDDTANAFLHTVIDKTGALLWQMGSADTGAGDEAADVDAGVRTALRDFIVLLDEHEVTLRLASGSRDFVLDRQAVAAARSRLR